MTSQASARHFELQTISWTSNLWPLQ